MRLSLVLLLCASTPALAIAKGATLFINSKDVSLQKGPSASAGSVMKLQPGTEVTWDGPSEKDKTWHQVTVNGKKGFVQQHDLSPHKPQQQVDASQKSESNKTFVSSGAAPRTPYGPGNAAEQEAAAELIYLEELNNAKATPQAIDRKSKELRK
jgi:plastocyanin